MIIIDPNQKRLRPAIAYFGGSFNPPHRGHRQVLEHLAQLPGFARVYLTPTFQHPWNKALLPYEIRRELCEALCIGLSNQVQICDIERQLPPPNRTFETLQALKAQKPDFDYVIVVGSDCKAELSKWHRFEELEKQALFYFVPRAGYEVSPFADASSTEIRNRLAKGKSISDLVTPEVEQKIKKLGLYQ